MFSLQRKSKRRKKIRKNINTFPNDVRIKCSRQFLISRTLPNNYTHTHTHSHQHTVTQTQNTFRHIRFGQFVNNRAERGQPSKSTTKRKTQNGNRKEFKIDAKFQQKKSKERWKNTKQQIQLPFFWTTKILITQKFHLIGAATESGEKNPWESINLIEQKKK